MSLAMSSDSILSTLSRSFMSKVLNFVKSIVPCKQYLHFQPYMLQKNMERYQHFVNYIIIKNEDVQSHQDFLHLCDVREISWTDLVLPLQL